MNNLLLENLNNIIIIQYCYNNNIIIKYKN